MGAILCYSDSFLSRFDISLLIFIQKSDIIKTVVSMVGA